MYRIAQYDSNLHSTMLLLYRYKVYGYKGLDIEFTFHYASTLSCCSDRQNSIQLYIYIPLCFYFIKIFCNMIHFLFSFTFHYASTLSVLLDLNSLQILYLHSTMLLLYPCTCDKQKLRQSYLHSTMLLLYLELVWRKCYGWFIYIPLCFYFIIYRFIFRKTGIIIYIPLCFYFILMTPALSIPTKYLHSTMLLLYLCRWDGGEWV